MNGLVNTKGGDKANALNSPRQSNCKWHLMIKQQLETSCWEINSLGNDTRLTRQLRSLEKYTNFWAFFIPTISFSFSNIHV